MGSEVAQLPFWGASWRLLLALILAALAVHLLAATNYYATIFLLALSALALVFAAARMLLHSRSVTDMIAANQAIARLQASEKTAARAQDHLQALLDTVSAALLVCEHDGRVVPANRAARLLARDEALANVTAIGPEAASKITSLAPGARAIIRLANGQQMLAAAAQFSGGDKASKLVSLQTVVGELDAVQLKAWQDMSRVLAHEIMNSLTPIASLSESLSGLLRAEEASRDSIEASETIARRSHGLVDFVDRYRQITNMPEPRPQAVLLKDFIAEIERLMAARMVYRSRVEPDNLSVLADPALLSQAVINLLLNASDAVAGKTASAIELTCTRDETEIVIAVADNGPGVPDQMMEDIFVPFFTTKPQGSGIGLSLVRQIALKHGGRVEAFRNPTGGATFRIALPAG
jgi:two-component system nitrogen regulation sensor histidine kinase NtrY